MTRVHERHLSAGPSAADRHRRVDQKKKTSYKVILEEVADKQKKLKTVVRRKDLARTSALHSDNLDSYIQSRKLPEDIHSFLLETHN